MTDHDFIKLSTEPFIYFNTVFHREVNIPALSIFVVRTI
ncbi:hypothetical protein THOM_0787 [Trachipleistophora hominis]|uniref:Uncharacterized protein n=1 Tax=Trachipleistophora hominis TaxID=72359 RepID=L7JYX3_TRAHO|nr:hypothetical protein THOM_0787 [Trachipleistophora hominis]